MSMSRMSRPCIPDDGGPCPPASGDTGNGGLAGGIPGRMVPGGSTGGGRGRGGGLPEGGSPDPSDDATELGVEGGEGDSARS